MATRPNSQKTLCDRGWWHERKKIESIKCYQNIMQSFLHSYIITSLFNLKSSCNFAILQRCNFAIIHSIIKMQFYYYAYRKTCMDVIKQTNYQDLETKIFRHNYEIEN